MLGQLKRIKSKIFDNIIVSTDSEKIKKISKECGAEVPFKREKFYDDNSPASLATWYMINIIETELGMVFENVFQLLPSCPFRDEKIIRNVIIILRKAK